LCAGTNEGQEVEVAGDLGGSGAMTEAQTPPTCGQEGTPANAAAGASSPASPLRSGSSDAGGEGADHFPEPCEFPGGEGVAAARPPRCRARRCGRGGDHGAAAHKYTRLMGVTPPPMRRCGRSEQLPQAGDDDLPTLTRSWSDSQLMDFDDTVSAQDVVELYNRFHESRQRDIRVMAKLEEWLVPRDRIRFGAELGRGAGGIVYLARWCGLQCAAKTLCYEASVQRRYSRKCATAEENTRKDLMNEITVLSHLRHPNLVLFLGACFSGDELIVLSEYIENGNFEQYVKACKGTVPAPRPAPLCAHATCMPPSGAGSVHATC